MRSMPWLAVDSRPMRQIVLDTETTGLEPELGRPDHRDRLRRAREPPATGRTFHRYLNPEREIDEAALAVHGLSRTELDGQPRFAEIHEELLAFLAAPSSSSTTPSSTWRSSMPSSHRVPARRGRRLPLPGARYARARARDAPRGSATASMRSPSATRSTTRTASSTGAPRCAHPRRRLSRDDRRPGRAG